MLCHSSLSNSDNTLDICVLVNFEASSRLERGFQVADHLRFSQRKTDFSLDDFCASSVSGTGGALNY